LIEEYVSLEEQCGFTTGRLCIGHIFTLRQILEKYQEKSKQIGMVFIDIEKAHDNFPRKLLRQALEQAAMSEHITDILKSMYSNNRCQVKVGSHLSREFYTSKGTSSRMLHITNTF
jgi:predicted GNAT family N-acyltransferase